MLIVQIKLNDRLLKCKSWAIHFVTFSYKCSLQANAHCVKPAQPKLPQIWGQKIRSHTFPEGINEVAIEGCEQMQRAQLGQGCPCFDHLAKTTLKLTVSNIKCKDLH